MEFTVMKLKDIPWTILEKYKKEFILPLNTEVNSAIYIKPDADISDAQIRDMVKLIGMSHIALVILDVDHLFVKEPEEWSVYGFYEPPKNIILSKVGRHIVKTFSDYLVEVNMFKEIINTPETLVFGMCHSGLVY